MSRYHFSVAAGSFACSLRKGQGQVESGAGCFLRVNPKLAAIRFDQRATDGQAHADAFGLGGEKGFEQVLDILFIEARSIVADCHLGNISGPLSCAR